MRSFRIWVGTEPDHTVLGTYEAESLLDLILGVWFLGSGTTFLGGEEGIYELLTEGNITYYAEEM